VLFLLLRPLGLSLTHSLFFFFGCSPGSPAARVGFASVLRGFLFGPRFCVGVFGFSFAALLFGTPGPLCGLFFGSSLFFLPLLFFWALLACVFLGSCELGSSFLFAVCFFPSPRFFLGGLVFGFGPLLSRAPLFLGLSRLRGGFSEVI